MASILAATYPELFAAVAIFAGAEFKAATSVSEGFAVMERGGPDPVQQGQLAFEAMSSGLARKKRRRMPVIVFHGTVDTRVNIVNADQAIAQWSKTNACLAAEHSEKRVCPDRENRRQCKHRTVTPIEGTCTRSPMPAC